MRTVLAAAMVCVLAGCGGGSAGGAAGAAAGGAPAKPLTVVNGDFEQGGDESGIPGWNQGQHAGPKSYEMAVDHDAPYAGSGSFRITRTREQFYGTISQNVDLDGKGGDLELAAMIKTKDVGPQG
ncbi:MAG TPA: hypothetical protein VFB32_00720, partial [Rudaea sp.]|nr:hypothetical protein [Rudaea sp.]